VSLVLPIGFQQNKDLGPLTTWQIGGKAKYFIEIDDLETLQETLVFCQTHTLSYFVIGRGSNLLISDDGYDGVVIRLGKSFAKVSITGQEVIAGASVPLAQLVSDIIKANLGEIEPWVGIPGSVGGAITMNASAHNSAISDGLVAVEVMFETGEHNWLTPEQLEFDYRHSILQDKNWIVLSAKWLLNQQPFETGKTKMQNLQRWRREKQPTNYPSGGSTFRNPDSGPSAGALIEMVGLKGHQIGQAQISDKHANFIVNLGGAKAQDVVDLMILAQKKIHEVHGIWLIAEVKTLGLSIDSCP
jgi:UDP-N-acetylmuramate dehydrogenase